MMKPISPPKPSKKGKRSGKSGSGHNSASTTSEAHPDNRNVSQHLTEDNDDNEWSEWEWDPTWQREWRSRGLPNGEWEYEYNYRNNSATPRLQSASASNNDAASIDGEVQEGDGFTHRSAMPVDTTQSSTPAATTGIYNSGVGLDPIHSLSAKTPSLHSGMDSNQNFPPFQQDVIPAYGAMTQSVGRDTVQYPSKSGQNYGSNNDDDYQSGPTTVPLMTDARGVPTKGGSWQSNVQYGHNRSDEDLVLDLRSMHLGDPDVSNSKTAPKIDPHRINGDVTLDEGSIEGQRETRLYGSFKVHKSKDFELGRIFKILWTEPKGQGRRPLGTESVPTIFNEQFYTSVRRFVICGPRDGHCLCLPILTYQYQGTAKHGVKRQDHAIIYTEAKDTKPNETQKQEKLLKKPIRMDPKTPRDQLDPASRLNYAKIYTIEYNVKVCFIGRIHNDSIRHFMKDFKLTHSPLFEGDYDDIPDADPTFQETGERELEPHYQSELQETVLPSPQDGVQGKDDQPSQSHRGREKERKKKR